MEDHYGGWDEETFTLIIGPEGKRLFVPRKIVLNIPYFASALKSGAFIEFESRTFNLPDDDAKALADVLYFTYTGEVKKSSIQYSTGQKRDSARAQHFQSLLRAYILADKYKAEVVANQLADTIIWYQDRSTLDPDSIWILSNAGLQDSPLYNLLLREMHRYLEEGDYNNYTVSWLDDDSDVVDFDEALQRLPKEDLIRFIRIPNRLERKEQYPIQKARSKLCDYHKHDLTETCKKPQPYHNHLTGIIAY